MGKRRKEGWKRQHCHTGWWMGNSVHFSTQPSLTCCIYVALTNLSNIYQVAPASHWPELEVLVLVVSGEKKSVSSTSGMQTTVLTSSLIQHRADVIVPSRMQQMEQAILQRNIEMFAKITMQVHST